MSDYKNRQNHKYSIEHVNAIKPTNTKLTALYFTERKAKYGARYVMCQCECGKNKEVEVCKVISGSTKTCGCRLGIKKKGVGYKYTIVNPYIYSCYTAMMERCYKPSCKYYKNYGAKGIIVCEEWKNNYQSFLDWALTNGWERGLELDKDILSPTKPGMLYSPETCCFVTHKVNTNNTSKTVYVTYNGKEMPLTEACEIGNLNYVRVSSMIYRGYAFEEAIIKQQELKGRIIEYDNKKMTATEWANYLGVVPATIHGRLKKGWELEKVLSKTIYSNRGTPKKRKYQKE